MAVAASRRILLTGASGFIGRALAARLRAEEWEVVELAHRPRAGALAWNPARGELPDAALENVFAVVSLAGENVAQRWTPAVKRRLFESRVPGTKLLAERIAAFPAAARPQVFVSASGVNYYGVGHRDLLDESAPPGRGFLAELTQAWEAAAAPAAAAGVRTVCARLGGVLGADGGMLAKMLPIFRAGLGGRAGPGTQRLSWLARTDAVAALLFLLARDDLAGPFNLTAPAPCTNAELAAALGRVLRRPAKIPAPACALRLLFGEMADETALADLAAAPRRLHAAGFQWTGPELEAALRRELTP